MNLDDKIKEALKMDTEKADILLSKEDGLVSQLVGIFRGHMMIWNMFGLVLALFTTVLMCWSGYHFFTSDGLDERVFYGVITLVTWTGTIGIKVWFWLEMNRNANHREIKRLELAIATLMIKLEQDKT